MAVSRGVFLVNPHISLADTTMNERGFTLSLRRMRRKWEWKMSLRDPIFAQFSAGALNFQSKWKERSCPSVPSRRIRSLRKKRRRIPRSSPGSCLLSLHARRPSPAARPSYTSRKYCSTKRCGAVILCLTHIYTMFRCLARSFSIRFPDPPHSGRAGMPHSHTPITGVWYVLPCYAVS